MKYIVDIDTPINANQERSYTLSGVNKALYIAKAIANSGNEVEFISPASTTKHKGFIKGVKYNLENRISIRLFPTFGCTNSILRKIRYVLLLINLFIYLLFNTKRNETILVYHEIKFCGVLYWLKKIKRLKYIMEVEEIYSDVRDYSVVVRKKEFRMICSADFYIFPTELLDEKLNQYNKPAIIIHGTYQVEPQIVSKFNDGKIHVIYAGTFDVKKGGAVAAIETAKYLPETYHIHICGFGTSNDITNIKNLILDTSKVSKASLSYDGLKDGRDYIEFMQHCHIGLCTQNPAAKFNMTSFPSKILSYLSNGLRVVSVRIEAIERSAVGTLLKYYDEQTPQNIAQAIRDVNIEELYDSRQEIMNLSNKFYDDITKLLNNKI